MLRPAGRSIVISAMPKKIIRLSRDKDFNNVWKNGRSAFDKILGVKQAANNSAASRFGITVGLKVSPKAVERNRVKRLLRAAIKNNLEKIKPGLDIVVVAMPPARESGAKALEASLAALLKRSGALTPLPRL